MYDAARNLALGKGLSIDGQLTNGVQPLLVFLIAPLFLILDRFEAVIAIQVLLTLIFVGSGFVLLTALTNPQDTVVARLSFLLVYFGSFSIVRHAFNGMETGLVLFLFSIILWQLKTYPHENAGWRQSLPLGLTLGLLCLARIDMIILAAIFPVFLALMGTRLASTATVAFVAAVTVSPWLLYNYVEFGSFIPTSGRALAYGIVSPFYVNVLGAVRRNASLFIFVELFPILLLLVVPVLAMGIKPLWSAMNRPQAALLAASLCTMPIIGLYYANYSYAAFFYPRYFILVSLFAALTFTFGLRQLMMGGTFVLFLISSALFLLNTWVFYTQKFEGISYWNGPTRDQVILAEKFQSECPRIAAFQTGTLGFWIDRPVKNLDGRVDAKSMAALWDRTLHREIDDRDCLIDFHDYIVGRFYWDPDLALLDLDRIYPAEQVEPQKYEWSVWMRRRP
ncbi:MAG: hypothetical protein ACK4MV_12245 [Beijerinckiaceae bacterium]